MAVPGGAGTAGIPIPAGAAPSSSDSSLSFHDAVPPQPPVSGLQVAVLLLVFGLAWLAVLGGTALVPPMDNIEQLDWVRSLQWGYYKHPPLPTALLWPWVQLFGLNGWVTYVLGTVVTLLALGLLWRMLRDMAGSRLATLALLAVLCITFYAGRLYYYNHNTVLLLGTVASAACAWQAFGGTGRRLGWWLLLGLALGITALGKYQIGLSVLSLIAFALHERSWRRPEQLRGLLLAGGVSALVFVPHVLWLVRSHGEAMDYALSTSVAATAYGWRSVGESLRWLADQLFNRALGAWLLLGIGVWRWRRTRPAEAPRQMPTVQEGAEPAGGDALARARVFLLLWGALPLGLMECMGLVLGSDLQLHWGVAYLPLLVPAVMLCWRGVNWSAVLAQPAVMRSFVVLQVLLLTHTVLTSSFGPERLRSRHWRTFDAPRVAAALAGPARQALGHPVAVLIGDSGVAGALALQLPERPLVLIGNNYTWSVWVPRDRVARCGAVLIETGDRQWDNTPRSASAEEAHAELTQDSHPVTKPVQAVTGTVRQPGGSIPSVTWTVIPPTLPGGCPAL